MQKVFEKIIEKLEEIRVKKTCNKEKCDTKELCRICVVDDAVEIVKQEAAEYNNGWIPVSERLPEEPEEGLTDIDECDEYIVMIKNAKIPTALNYAGNGEWYRDGVFYDVIAWQTLPEPYQPKGE